jgi:hypothetical protein
MLIDLSLRNQSPLNQPDPDQQNPDLKDSDPEDSHPGYRDQTEIRRRSVGSTALNLVAQGHKKRAQKKAHQRHAVKKKWLVFRTTLKSAIGLAQTRSAWEAIGFSGNQQQLATRRPAPEIALE